MSRSRTSGTRIEIGVGSGRADVRGTRPSHDRRGPGRTDPSRRALTGRTRVLLGVLAATAVLGGAWYGWRVPRPSGGTPVAGVNDPTLTTDMDRLRAMELGELKLERARRAAALEALMAQGGGDAERMADVREAARRATVALHEKEPAESDR